VEMICMQPSLDVCGIANNRRCRCLRCGLLGGGAGWLHVSLAVIRMDGNDNCNGNCLSKKGVGRGKRTGGIERWVCFYMLSYFIIVFWLTFFNAGQLISVVVAACCRYHHGEKKVSQQYYIYLFICRQW
jgi:hypothetical protein